MGRPTRPQPPLWLALLDSPLGSLSLVYSPVGLRAVRLAGHPRKPSLELPHLEEATPPESRRHVEVCHWETSQALQRYFTGTGGDFTDLILDPGGTPFQLRVWEAARAISCGQTLSYGELAGRLGLSQGARAVGQALGANPLLIIVPCHRVLAANGSLGGFSAGLAVKRALLSHERAMLGISPFPLYGPADGVSPSTPPSTAALMDSFPRSCRRKKLRPS